MWRSGESLKKIIKTNFFEFFYVLVEIKPDKHYINIRIGRRSLWES